MQASSPPPQVSQDFCPEKGHHSSHRGIHFTNLLVNCSLWHIFKSWEKLYEYCKELPYALTCSSNWSLLGPPFCHAYIHSFIHSPYWSHCLKLISRHHGPWPQILLCILLKNKDIQINKVQRSRPEHLTCTQLPDSVHQVPPLDALPFVWPVTETTGEGILEPWNQKRDCKPCRCSELFTKTNFMCRQIPYKVF